MHRLDWTLLAAGTATTAGATALAAAALATAGAAALTAGGDRHDVPLVAPQAIKAKEVPDDGHLWIASAGLAAATGAAGDLVLLLLHDKLRKDPLQLLTAKLIKRLTTITKKTDEHNNPKQPLL